jgi:thiol:disulfide interchange protein DsbD
MIFKKITFFFSLFLLSTFAFAQGQGPKKVNLSTNTKILSETEALLTITAKIYKGWHLYCFNPGGDGMLIAPKVTFEKNANITLVGKTTENGKKITEEVDGVGTIFYFENEVKYIQKIKYKKLDKIKASLFYQTCDHETCERETTENVVFDMVNAEGSKLAIKEDSTIKVDTVAVATTPPIDTTAKNTNENTDTTATAQINTTGKTTTVYGDYGTPVGDCGEIQKEELSMWTAFLYGLLGGLAALFFPCTLPMIPMTISFFLKGSGDKKKGVQRGIMYGFFIFLVYFLLSLPFLFLGWGGNALNSFSTNVWVNLVFFVVFIIFAFSLFGYYDISLPSSVSSKIDAKSSISSAGGIFFMALTLAIVSFSCTGPILGLVLGNISNSKLITPAMSGFGIGLGVPFALFAMFPNLLKALPKSGGWLTVLKVVFGFIELAFALKFLSNADLVKQWGFLKRELFIGLWIVVLILLALYLLGKLKFKEDPTFKSTTIMKGLAIFSIVFAGYLSFDFFGKDISLVSGFPPPKFYSFFHKEEKLKKGSTARVHNLKGINVYLYLEDAIAEGKKQNKPVMIDFTGWACVNCRKMEENVWTKSSVNKLLSDQYIIASLYVDEQIELPKNEQFASPFLDKKFATTVGDKWFDLSLRHFKSATQPFYALIDPVNNRILNTPRGFTPSESEYIKFLECGLTNYKSLR